MSEIFESLKPVEEKQLPSELFDKTNISIKTEITNPIAISVLEVFAEQMKNLSEEDGVGRVLENVVKRFIAYYKTNMVSYKRQSRKEFVEAVRSIELQVKEEEAKNKFLKV